jgi:hypothetical protein
VHPFVACRAEAGHKKEDKDPIHPKGLRRERVLNLSVYGGIYKAKPSANDRPRAGLLSNRSKPAKHNHLKTGQRGPHPDIESEERLVPFLGMANVLSGEERTHNESPRSCFGNYLGD